MFVYIDEEGFDEEHIKAPILRPFLMYSMFSATFMLSVLYFTFKNEDFSLLHLDVVMQCVLYVVLWLIMLIYFLFTLPTVSFGRKGFMVKDGSTNLYREEDLAFLVYSEQEGLWIKDGGPTDAEWEAYKKKLVDSCGMDELLKVYQAAYDRYLAAKK